VFDFVKELSRDNLQAALELIAENAEGGEWTVPRLTEAMSGYWEEHGRIRLDPEARNAKHSHIDEVPDERRWQVEQVLIDPEELNDWSAVFDVNLEKSDTEGVPVLALTKLGPVAVH
jgi:hypothetical protein